MCGIHGIYRLDGQAVSQKHLSAMGNVTQHRGPDDEGMHIDAACGIAMRRLSIIDVEGGHHRRSVKAGSSASMASAAASE